MKWMNLTERLKAAGFDLWVGDVVASAEADVAAEMPDVVGLAQECEREKAARVYYQNIVYAVCQSLDELHGRNISQGTGIVCGTLETPSAELQKEITALCADYKALATRAARPDTLAAVVEALRAAEKRLGQRMRIRLHGNNDHAIDAIDNEILRCETLMCADSEHLSSALAAIAPTKPEPTLEEDTAVMDTLFRGPVPLGLEREAWQRLKRRLQEQPTASGVEQADARADGAESADTEAPGYICEGCGSISPGCGHKCDRCRRVLCSLCYGMVGTAGTS